MKNLIVCLLLLLTRVQASEWLDQPIKLDGRDVMEVLYSMTSTIRPEDRQFFEPAYLALCSEFMVRKGYEAVPTKLREQALANYVDGITPRKLIFVGIMIRARNENARDEFETELSGEELTRRRAHMKKHGEAADALVVAALMRYGSSPKER